MTIPDGYAEFVCRCGYTELFKDDGRRPRHEAPHCWKTFMRRVEIDLRREKE